MLPKDAKIFMSFHLDEESLVPSVLAQVRTAGWKNIIMPDKRSHTEAISELIGQSEIALIFLSKAYARDDRLMLEEFAYSSVVVRKPFLPVWLNDIGDIQQDCPDTEQNRQLLSALEMLTAKHFGGTVEELVTALEQFTPFNPPYTPSTPQICEKPCEAYEGKEPYLFISYAHDDAKKVYPIVKNIYEAGWDLWYDEGIKTTERYLPVIADHVNRCTAFVLMLTNRCLERPFVMNYELEYARQRDIPIIPVLLEEINPPEWAKEITEKLLKNAIAPKDLYERIATHKDFPNRRTRKAVPPAIKQNMVYDVVLPPKVPGFEIAVQGDEVTLTKYIEKETNVVIPGTVKTPNEEMEFRITVIGEGTFAGCESLTHITIQEGVTRIGERAFANCTSLTSITIPESVMSIGGATFVRCESLKSIVIPSSVTSIGNGAFHSCEKLTNVTILGDIASIGWTTFYDCVSLSGIILLGNVTSIGERAFQGCKKLSNITLPEGITSIGELAFGSCTSLRHINIPEGVKYIAGNAFGNTPLRISGRGVRNQAQEAERKQPCSSELPQYKETPRALICCAEEDVQNIRTLLIELYWEGFNVHYEEMPNQKAIEGSKCVLAFFSEHTAKSKMAMDTLKQAIEIGADCIIQVCLKNFVDLPSEIRGKLHDRLAIRQNESTEREFTGRIRESLRQFKCSLEHPRGFDVKNNENSVEISKFHPTDFPEVIIPKTFFNPPLQVMSIGDHAFNNCESLISITITESVTSIGDYAFRNCKSLTHINIPKNITNVGNSAFKGCPKLDLILCAGGTTLCHYPENNLAPFYHFPENITSISRGAFADCEFLKSIIIPNSITSIDDNTFSWCKSLFSITIPESVTSIGNYAFRDCTSLTNINIPKSVASIGEFTFLNCTSLTSINIPGRVTSISHGAFSDCKSLTSITIPEGVTRIGNSAFSGCKSLTSITIPIGVTSIGGWAFHFCESLTSITISKNVTSIGESAFNNCTSLTNINVNSKNTIYTSKEGVLFVKNMTMLICYPVGNKRKEYVIPKGVTNIYSSAFEDCKSLTSITIPKSVTSIGGGAFERCTSLTSIAIPESVTSIGNGTFHNCKSLTSITIPKSVTSIGRYTFWKCSSLSSITIPESVTNIGESAFQECTSLTSIIIPKSVTSIDSNAFYCCQNLTIHTPHGSAAWQYAEEHGIKHDSLMPITTANSDSHGSFLQRLFAGIGCMLRKLIPYTNRK